MVPPMGEKQNNRELNERSLKQYDALDFTCKCGCGYLSIHSDLVRRLEVAGGVLGYLPKINSGCRCKAYNATVKGSSQTSSHLNGYAADLAVTTDEQRYLMIRALTLAGFNRIGIGQTYIHVDVDPSKNARRIWVY